MPLLADLRLAIALLLAIAIASISGTVIEQGQSLSFYQENYPEQPALFGFLTWKFILSLGLNHAYSTWWFLALLILFGSSLSACTFRRQWPALKAARGWSFYRQPRQFEKLAFSAELDPNALNSLLEQLQHGGYRIFQEQDSLYARKGLMGRVGPIVVHASMLIILLGAILGALTGFFAQEMVPSGSTFQIENIFEAGPLAAPQVPDDWSVHVNRFWIDYTPTGSIDQFYSDLSVLDRQGNEAKRQTISVNHPLRYHGVTLYQADWSVAAVRVQLNNSPILRLPMAPLDTPTGAKIWGTWLPTKPDLSEGVSLVTTDLQGTVFIYGADGQPLGTARTGMATEVNDLTLRLVELVGSTGLQIKADPGIPLVYAGFGLLMLGVIMSYVSHSQVWALVKGDRLYLGGRTNRAQVTFERELFQILASLQSPGPHPQN
ncbi:MAG: cytochrome c biogenesis protein [Cyanobacteria bacterium P01_H01_bin.121]